MVGALPRAIRLGLWSIVRALWPESVTKGRSIFCRGVAWSGGLADNLVSGGGRKAGGGLVAE